MFFIFLHLFFFVNANGRCSKSTCFHGQCLENRCVCFAGVTGETCNTDLIDCDENSCLNDGTCVEMINGFHCKCSKDFFGSRCQHRSICSSCENSSNSIRNCSLLKFRIDHHETTCIAMNKSPLIVDVDCQCDYDGKEKRSILCELTSFSSSRDRCVFRKSVSSLSPSSVFSMLTDRISIYICPVNWQMFSRYEIHPELISSVEVKRCLLSSVRK